MPDNSEAPNRLARRKQRTRTALVKAAQRLIAEGRVNVPVLEITRAADVGMGSFYNHFESKAGVNALELKAMVRGKRVAAPPTLIQKYPELRRFADPSDDPTEESGPQLSLLA